MREASDSTGPATCRSWPSSRAPARRPVIRDERRHPAGLASAWLGHHGIGPRRVRAHRHRRNDTEPGTPGQDIFVTRLTSTGATDTTFGTNGVAQFAISTGSPPMIGVRRLVAARWRDRAGRTNCRPFRILRLPGDAARQRGSTRSVLWHQRSRDHPLPRIDGEQSRPQAGAAAGRQDRAGRLGHGRRVEPSAASRASRQRHARSQLRHRRAGAGARIRGASTPASNRTASWSSGPTSVGDCSSVR